MNLATSREILRRRLMEVNPDNWSNDALKDLLNLGVTQAQKAIEAVQPGAFLSIYRQDIVANEEFYAKPAGFWYEIEVSLKNTDSARYEPIGQMGYPLNNERSAPFEPTDLEGETVKYSHFGTHLAIHPIPTALVTNGLQIKFQSTLAFADDSDVLPLNLGLHMLPVAWAHRFAIGETGEKVDEVNNLIDRLTLDIPTWYRATGAPGLALVPDFVKDYR